MIPRPITAGPEPLRNGQASGVEGSAGPGLACGFPWSHPGSLTAPAVSMAGWWARVRAVPVSAYGPELGAPFTLSCAR
jgi:hypothetical protein